MSPVVTVVSFAHFYSQLSPHRAIALMQDKSPERITSATASVVSRRCFRFDFLTLLILEKHRLGGSHHDQDNNPIWRAKEPPKQALGQWTGLHSVFSKQLANQTARTLNV
jgi:hypothetical protein